jgi:hypothetical protein
LVAREGGGLTVHEYLPIKIRVSEHGSPFLHSEICWRLTGREFREISAHWVLHHPWQREGEAGAMLATQAHSTDTKEGWARKRVDRKWEGKEKGGQDEAGTRTMGHNKLKQ